VQHRLIEDENGRSTVVAVLDAGDEAVASLTDVARAHELTAASVTAVGAVERATVGWYDLERQEYQQIEVEEQAELLSLVGDVAQGPDGMVALHAHVVLGLHSGETRGGHLLEATVRPTLEAVFSASPAQLRKTFRPEFGLALIDLDASSAP
jgi:predicted DNA-binding protein with PD1-like motif